MSEDLKKQCDDLQTSLSTKDKELKAAQDKITEFEKKIAVDVDLKTQNDALTKELDSFRAERKVRVDSIKEKLSAKNPLMKEMIDSASDDVILKMEKDSEVAPTNNHISARMEGNDKNRKEINDKQEKVMKNYFPNKKEVE